MTARRRTLEVEAKGGEIMVAVFVKDLRTGGWSCVEASAGIEWFKRVRHPEVIHNWLFDQRLPFRWLPQNKC